jgi:hypothetical protein
VTGVAMVWNLVAARLILTGLSEIIEKILFKVA